MNILSPMAYGNGAYIVHRTLEENIHGYNVCGFNPYWTLFPPALYCLCHSNSADVVHTTPDYGAFFRDDQKPLVLSFQNIVLDPFMRSFSSPLQQLHYRSDLRLFTLRALKNATMVTAVSKFTAKLIRKELNFSNDIQVIYNGVDVDRFTPNANETPKTIRVLFSGNLTRRKGADLLPAIAKQLNKDITIQYTRGLRTRNTSLKLPNVEDLGTVKHSDMPKVYQQADILLMPTVREGHSVAVLEAMASGLPVVATNCSSLPEQIIDREGGFLCEIGKSRDFAQRINYLADSPRLRLEMGQYNRERVTMNFTTANMVNDYNQLFEKVVSNQ